MGHKSHRNDKGNAIIKGDEILLKAFYNTG